MTTEVHFPDVARWIESRLDPTLPRDFVHDLALVALGKKQHRTALPLVEAAARLNIDELGHIAALYVNGLERTQNGYNPLLGAANLARKFLANPDIPKFAVNEKVDLRGGQPFRILLNRLALRIKEKPEDRSLRIYHKTLHDWAKEGSESDALLLNRAYQRFGEWFELDDTPRLFFELLKEMRLMRAYEQVARAQQRFVVKANRMLPKELRQIRA